MSEVEIVEVTAPIEIAIVGDRLHATVTSGTRKRTYALAFAKAREAAERAARALNEHQRQPSVVKAFRRKRPSAHG